MGAVAFLRRAHGVLATVSSGCPPPKGTFPRVTHPSAGVRSRSFLSRDLHVLGLPPAFVLSQDQTLRFMSSRPKPEIHLTTIIATGSRPHKQPKPSSKRRALISRDPNRALQSTTEPKFGSGPLKLSAKDTLETKPDDNNRRVRSLHQQLPNKAKTPSSTNRHPRIPSDTSHIQLSKNSRFSTRLGRPR